jgi:signal transduction histidine kinase
MARRKTLVTYLIAYFFTIGTAFRYLSLGRNEPFRWTVAVQRTIAGLFVAFFLLLVLEPRLTRRSRRYTHVYLAVQTVIISALSLITPSVDYFSALFLSLAVQAMYVFPLGTGSRWVGAFTVIMATLMLYGHPLSKGLPLVIIMSVAYLFIGSYAAVTREAEAAREDSQRLLAELQDAHEQLQSYAAQAEELAVAAERRRAQEALEAAHAFQQSIMDSVTEPIMVIGLDYRLESMNRAAREFSSGSGGGDESQPLTCYRVSRHRETPCDGIEYPCPLEQVRELGQPVTVVHDHYQANGERRFNEVIASPLWGEDGTFQGIIESVRDITERIQAEEALQQYAQRLRALAVQLAEVAEAERQTLARELHDRVGQNLTALGINLNIVRAQIPEVTAAAVRSRLDDSLSLVEQTTERIRDVMANLRPPVLDDYGLVAALQWYGEQFTRRTGIAVEGEEPAPRLDAHVENALFRIAQEALTNVAKHAQATRASVTVEANGGTLRLVVADDGTGFDPAHPVEPDGGQGWGLITMAERAEAVNGRCCIESTPGQGTQIAVEVTR